jgi:hypothetical protein
MLHSGYAFGIPVKEATRAAAIKIIIMVMIVTTVG